MRQTIGPRASHVQSRTALSPGLDRRDDRWADRTARVEVCMVMQWEQGLKGLAFLVFMSIVFGFIALAVAGRATTGWLWPIASVAYFIGGLFSDEGLLFGLIFGIASIFVTWFLTRRRRRHRIRPSRSLDASVR